MQSLPTHSGEMSQGFAMADKHRMDVPATSAPPNIAPAARKTKRAYNALSASSVGLELGIAVIVGVLGGMWLDSHFGTTPWLMLLFLVFGLVAGTSFRCLSAMAKPCDISPLWVGRDCIAGPE